MGPTTYIKIHTKKLYFANNPVTLKMAEILQNWHEHATKLDRRYHQVRFKDLTLTTFEKMLALWSFQMQVK